MPAIVTAVNEDGTLDLTAFPPGVSPAMLRGIPEKDETDEAKKRFGVWSWPPRSE